MFDGRPAAGFNHFRDRLILSRGDNQTLTGDGSQQQVELGLDRRQVGEYIRVVIFEIIENQRPWAVVYEFGAPVEVAGVVFISLNDKEGGFPQPRRLIKVARCAANEVAGFEASVIKNPGKHAGRRGFAMGTSNSKDPSIPEYRGAQPLRP